MDSFTYCRRWNFRRHIPIKPLTTEQAKKRDAEGKEYAVIFTGPHGVPSAVVEVVWQNNHLGIWFFDALGRQIRNDAFRRSNGKLFLFDSITYTYPNSDARGLASSGANSHTVINEDGTVHRILTDASGNVTTTPKTKCDVTANWERMPTFGDWQKIATPKPRVI